MLTVRRAPASICGKLFFISVIDSKYTPDVISPVLLSKNSTFIERFFFKKFSINLNSWSPLLNMESKLNLSHNPEDLNKVQLTEIRKGHA